MTFLCKRCGYETNIKQSLIRHLRKIKECPPVNDTSERIHLINELRTDKQPILSNKKVSCKYCAQGFDDKSNMYKHMKICRKNPKRIQFEYLEKQIEELKRQIQASTNHSMQQNVVTNNQIIQNFNIQLKDFGFEKTDHLPRHFLNNCFANKRIVELIENIHFDQECPENHNVRIRSTKKEYMEVFENGKWTIKDQDQILTDLIQKGYRILSKHGKTNQQNIMEEEYLDEEDFHEVCEWMERVYDDQKAQKPLKRDLIIRFLNNQAIVLAR